MGYKHDKIKEEVLNRFKDYQIVYLATAEENQPNFKFANFSIGPVE